MDEVDEQLLTQLAYNARGDLCPMQGVIGGITAQEVMKVNVSLVYLSHPWVKYTLLTTSQISVDHFILVFFSTFNTSLCHRAKCNLTSFSNVCKAVPRSLFWIPMDSMNYQKCVSNFLLTSLSNQQWYFQPVNHGVYSNPGRKPVRT